MQRDDDRVTGLDTRTTAEGLGQVYKPVAVVEPLQAPASDSMTMKLGICGW